MGYTVIDRYRGKDVQRNFPRCGDIYVFGSDERESFGGAEGGVVNKIWGSCEVIESYGWLVVTVESASALRVNEITER
jgi:hypothetical protein